MFSFLRDLLGGSSQDGVTFYPKGAGPEGLDELARLGLEPRMTEKFLTKLVENGVFVIARNFKDSDSGKNFEFLDYTEDNVGIFPVFSSLDEATRFIQTLKHSERAAYTVLGVKIDFLTKNEFSGLRIFLNPRSRFEREITKEELTQLE